MEGLIWFWVPASLVICNDCFAYIWGKTIGRTPLIKLSPKKTVEGFVGAFISTLIFAVLWGTYFARFDYMICPVQDLGVSAWSSTACKPNPVFVWKTVEVWQPVAIFLTTLVSVDHSYSTFMLTYQIDGIFLQDNLIYDLPNSPRHLGLLRVSCCAFRWIFRIWF